MAWLDDRAWCHPKLVNLSDRAFRVYVNGIAYASGMGTRGVLTAAQQRILTSSSVVRAALVEGGLWEPLDDGSVTIHDWDNHNGKRDDRRERDRERKRAARAVEKNGSPQDSPRDGPQETQRTSRGQNGGPARVEGSEGSDGSEVRQITTSSTAVEGRARRVEIFVGSLKSPADRKVFDEYGKREQSEIAFAWPNSTGWRRVRGTHGEGFKPDPLGTDRHPNGSDRRPSATEFLEAWTKRARVAA